MNNENFSVIKNPELWDLAWQESIRAREQGKPGGLNRWNKRTGEFAKRAAGEKPEPRVQRVLNWLQVLGVDWTDGSILDIGAGSGAFAIPFAQSAAEIVAVEPAERMAELLKQRVQEAEARQVEIVVEPWETLDVEKREWSGRFDLVFASQCPGINSWETAEKALRCAKRYCFFSSFAGKRENSAIRDVWPLLTGSEQPPFTLDIIYLQNLLYLKGYDFDFRVFEEKRTVQIDEQAAFSHIMDGLAAYNIPAGVEAEEVITAYIRDQAAKGGGLVEITSSVRFGHLLVRVG